VYFHTVFQEYKVIIAYFRVNARQVQIFARDLVNQGLSVAEADPAALGIDRKQPEDQAEHAQCAEEGTEKDPQVAVVSHSLFSHPFPASREAGCFM
jgi:hypothetical protein